VNANKVWLNGTLLVQNKIYHAGSTPDQYARGNWKAGRNVILVKLARRWSKLGRRLRSTRLRRGGQPFFRELHRGRHRAELGCSVFSHGSNTYEMRMKDHDDRYRRERTLIAALSAFAIAFACPNCFPFYKHSLSAIVE
jgi:hypothetical protein